MIVEGLVTTTGADGRPHLAAMGPRWEPGAPTLELWPFPTSATYANLLRHPEGVFHLTDDALLLAHAAVGAAAIPPTRPAQSVKGFVLPDCCRALEFRVVEADPPSPRARLKAEIVRTHEGRPWWGWNRAKHAVLEAAILATRFDHLPLDEIARQFDGLRVIVGKTGGPAEHEAMAFLQGRLDARRGAGP